MSVAKKVALAAIGGIGAYAAINKIMKPSKTQDIVSSMRGQLDEYNSTVHPEQDRSDTIFDRSKLLHDAKARKPWNMTYAEKEMAERANVKAS